MKRLFVYCSVVFLFSCQNLTQTKTGSKQFLLERLANNEVAVSRSYLDDFSSLPVKDKIKLYYLSRAAIAGRDIYYDQRHRDAIKVREFFELVLNQNKLKGALKGKVEEFLKLIYVNNGHYHARTGHKLLPSFTFAELKKEMPQADIAWLEDVLFDSAYDKILTNLTPKPGEGDIIAASSNNIYSPGLALKDLESLDKKWLTKVNVSFEKQDDQILPQTYKIGGRYGQELARVAHFLKLAAELSEGDSKEGLLKLVGYYESGDEEAFRQACISWLKSEPRVDAINGFIESYMDPRQVVGSWEGMAYYISENPVLKGFANNVQYFEDHMPWNEEYKKKNITTKPVATVINVAVATGEGGPITWSGINLPNYQDIRVQHGSKNVILGNMVDARSQVLDALTIDNFYLPEYQSIMRKHASTAKQMLLFMHEVVGHGSGQTASSVKVDPRNLIGENYGAWEEARASLVAWHHIVDDKLIELGAFAKEEQQDVIKAFYLSELQSQLLTLRNATGEDVLREAHDRADQMIFEYVRQASQGFDVVNVDGAFYVKINDVAAVHKAASDLLRVVHNAKATGDKKTVDAYLEKYGNQFNKTWQSNIVERAEKVGLPEFVAVVFPTLKPVFEEGKIVDVVLDNSESFLDQQQRFGRVSESTEVTAEIY